MKSPTNAVAIFGFCRANSSYICLALFELPKKDLRSSTVSIIVALFVPGGSTQEVAI